LQKTVDISFHLGYCMSIYSPLGYSVSYILRYKAEDKVATAINRQSKIEVSPHLNITPLMGRAGIGPAHSSF
jgi:hypothetical protein